MNQKSGSRVRDIQVRNRETGKFEKLNPNKTYYVATNDFTANKGDGYDMFGGQREEGISLDEVVGNYIQKHNLNEYNTNNPERIINGKLDSVKKSTHKSDNCKQSTHKSDNGKQSSNHTHKKSA
ncbi:5'-nucleotidase family protein (fragment) [Staphylococcus capitis]